MADHHEKKSCKVCKEPKAPRAFPVIKSTGKPDSWCRACRKKYNRIYNSEGLKAAQAALGLSAKNKGNRVSVGDIVKSNNNRYVVCNIFGRSAKIPEVAGHRIMGNGQVLKRSVFRLGVNYSLQV